jgi:CRP/FNR family transcriptional regulator
MGVEELQALNHIACHKIIPAGQVIFAENEEPAFFANILSGAVKLTKSLSDGRQQIVGILFSPDFLGRALGRTNACFAEAATEVELCSYPAGAFTSLMKRYPALEHRLYEKTLDELDAARDWMVLLGRKTAREKVASFLYMLARRARMAGCRQCGDDGIGFDLPLRRVDIADYLGLTIETVSRQITRLRADGLIVTGGKPDVRAPDMAALARAAGQDGLEES